MKQIRYEDYKYLIYKVINHYEHIYRIHSELKENLIFESNILFLKCISKWDRKNTKFSTFFYKCLLNNLKWHILSSYRNIIIETQEKDFFDNYFSERVYKKEGKWHRIENNYLHIQSPLEMTMYRLNLNYLSEEAKEIINTILYPPHQILLFLSEKYRNKKEYRINKEVLTEYFYYVKKWPKKNIKLIFKEIENILK